MLHCTSDTASPHYVIEEHLELTRGNSPVSPFNLQVYRYELLHLVFFGNNFEIKVLLSPLVFSDSQ